MRTCDHDPIHGTGACLTCPAPPDWKEHALCATHPAGPETWFAADHAHGRTAARPTVRVALAVCATCLVRPYCLEEGWHQDHGIWGGWQKDDRKHMRRARPNLDRAQIRALAALIPGTD